MYNIPNIPTIYIFLNMTCWVHIMLFVCMSTELTIQHRNDNCCAFPWGHHFFCSQLYSIACNSLCWVEALGALHCSLWHDCWCLLLGEILRVLLLILLVDTISQQTPWFSVSENLSCPLFYDVSWALSVVLKSKPASSGSLSSATIEDKRHNSSLQPEIE